MTPPPPCSSLFPYTTLFRSTATLTDVADAYVQSGNASTNYGSITPLLVKNGNGGSTTRYAFLKFDLSSIPGPVSSADRKSTRLNSSHANISYAVFCLKKKKK